MTSLVSLILEKEKKTTVYRFGCEIRRFWTKENTLTRDKLWIFASHLKKIPRVDLHHPIVRLANHTHVVTLLPHTPYKNPICKSSSLHWKTPFQVFPFPLNKELKKKHQTFAMDPQQRRTETARAPPVGEPGGDVTSIFMAFGVFIAIAALVIYRLLSLLWFDVGVFTRIPLWSLLV